VAARLRTEGGSFAVTRRESLVPLGSYLVGQNHTTYDVSPDDRRFLVLSPEGGGSVGRLVWVRNWLEQWEQRAGGGG
jgi:hypothetical protein